MQPNSRELQGMAASLNCLSAPNVAQIVLHDPQNVDGQQDFDHSAACGAGHDDFFDQMLSGLPGPWPELEDTSAVAQKLFNIGLSGKSAEEAAGVAGGLQYRAPYDESSLLTSRLRQHQITGGGSGSSPTGKQMMFQLNHQQSLLHGARRSPTSASGDVGLLPVPPTMGESGGERDEVDASYKSTYSAGSEGFYNGFVGSIPGSAQAHHFHNPQGESMGSQSSGGALPSAGTGQAASGIAGASASACGVTAPPRQRVRARRGQATDPHSIAERLRRERIAERMKALQELVPNANKTDKTSMLDEIIDYVKFLQLQVKVLSMSRLGGAGAVAPLVADMSSERGMACSGANGGGAGGANDNSIAVTEHQVAKLMEEDMGSAMQYLQGKGLCLMPISLASAISSATCHPGPLQASSAAGIAAGLINHGLVGAHLSNQNGAAADGSSSPSVVSVLTMQSAAANGAADVDGSRLSGNKNNNRP